MSIDQRCDWTPDVRGLIRQRIADSDRRTRQAVRTRWERIAAFSIGLRSRHTVATEINSFSSLDAAEPHPTHHLPPQRDTSRLWPECFVTELQRWWPKSCRVASAMCACFRRRTPHMSMSASCGANTAEKQSPTSASHGDTDLWSRCLLCCHSFCQ